MAHNYVLCIQQAEHILLYKNELLYSTLHGLFFLLFRWYCFIYAEVCLYYLLRIGPQDKDEHSSIRHKIKLWMHLILQLNLNICSKDYTYCSQW